PLYLYVVYCFAFGMTFFVIGNIVLSSFFKEGWQDLTNFLYFLLPMHRDVFKYFDNLLSGHGRAI
ncbi:TPA: hypothetical protein ACHWQU_002825, partial [Shigella flexneri 2a]